MNDCIENFATNIDPIYFNSGHVRNRSYDFILRTAEAVLAIFRECGRYCDKFEIDKVTDTDGRIFYVLTWE